MVVISQRIFFSFLQGLDVATPGNAITEFQASSIWPQNMADSAYVGLRLAEYEASSSNTVHRPNALSSMSTARICQHSTRIPTSVVCSIQHYPKQSASASPGSGHLHDRKFCFFIP
jgi:hypothetical protein